MGFTSAEGRTNLHGLTIPGLNAAFVPLGLILSTVLTPVAAMAQQAPDTKDGSTLEDIVVTAQRREQNLQDTPIAVSAFTSKALEASGVKNVAELAQLEPSLNVPHIVGVYLPFLRGIGNAGGGSVGNESSVPVYIDDMYYTRLSTAYLALDTVDRVEVLKGPQGTLFGRNSSGGAIQIFTRDPGRTAEFSGSVGYGNYDTITGQVYTSLPITDTLAWNIAAGGTKQLSGWGKDLTTGADAYLESNATIRSKLLWEPSDRTRVKIVGFYAHTDGDIGVAQDRHSGTYGASAAVSLPGYPNPPITLPSLADVPGAGFYDTRLNFREDARENGYGGSLRIDQKLGFADLVSITGFRNGDGYNKIDGDLSSQPFRASILYDKDRQFTQEVQLKSKSASRVSWIVGGFYLHSKAGYTPSVIAGDSVTLAYGDGAVQKIYSQQVINSLSAFGQTTIPLSDTTNLTAGLRFTHDEVSGTGRIVVSRPTGDTTLGSPYADSKTFQQLTWKAALDHHFTDDIMGYASISRGFKAGTFSTLPLNRPPANPEIVDAYEVGIKTELFDRRVRLNGALFWNEVKDPQVLLILPQGLVLSAVLANADKSRVKGGELTAEVVATNNLRLRGALTYLDGKYVRFTNAPFYYLNGTGIAGPVTGDASGNRLPNTSKWRFEVGANYAAEAAIGKFVADVSISYTGPFAWNPDNFVIENAYTLVNASVSYTPKGLDNVTFTLWGKNLGDVKYYGTTQENAGAAGTGGFQASAAAPRTFGGRISFKF